MATSSKSKPSTKTKVQAQKVAKDITFGMKNKSKSKKVQNYVSQIQKQQEGNAKKPEQTKSKKQLKAEKDAEYNALFKPVIPTHKDTPAGTDPHTIICEFFKQGRCTKGNKCRFSHDMSQERKSEKRDLFSDSRDVDPEAGTEENYMETNEGWDEDKLRTVVNAKATKGNETEIVCKFFITAIENNKYGWFWECPNGSTCKYRHALPPNYVFKINKKRDDEEEEEKESMEDALEKERSALKGGTPLTLEVFMKWKEQKNKQKNEQQKKAAADKGIVTGRDLFMLNPELAQNDDADAADDAEIHKQVHENELAHDNAPVTLPTNPEPENTQQEEGGKEEKGTKTGGVSKVEIDASMFTGEDLPEDLEVED